MKNRKKESFFSFFFTHPLIYFSLVFVICFAIYQEKKNSNHYTFLENIDNKLDKLPKDIDDEITGEKKKSTIEIIKRDGRRFNPTSQQTTPDKRVDI